jgi:hypothetical protein
VDDRSRSRLKREMLLALGPDTCVQTPCKTREEVLELIRTGAADLLVSVADGGKPFEHYAIRFNDRGLGDRAREDSLHLYLG